MQRDGLLAFRGGREVGHHGSKVKIRERPSCSSGNRSIRRENGFEGTEDEKGVLDANANLSFINGSTDARSKYAVREHLPNHRHITVSVEYRNNLRHASALARLCRLQERTGEGFIDVPRNDVRLVEHKVSMHQGRDPPNGVQIEVFLWHICCERVHLSALVRHAFFGQDHTDYSQIGAVSVAVKHERQSLRSPEVLQPETGTSTITFALHEMQVRLTSLRGC